MEIGNKAMAAAGFGLFILGGVIVYFFMNVQSGAAAGQPKKRTPEAMHAAIAQLEQQTPKSTGAYSSLSEHTQEESNTAGTMTHAAFIAEAEAKREQNREEKAEADRLEKLEKIKQNSTECKFWKQQQRSSSAAAKIDEKIARFCTLQTSSISNDTTTSSVSQ